MVACVIGVSQMLQGRWVALGNMLHQKEEEKWNLLEKRVVRGGWGWPSGRPDTGPCVGVMLGKSWTGHLPSLGTQMPKGVLGNGGGFSFHQ